MTQYLRSFIAAAESVMKRVGNIDSDIDADFVDQSQRTHGHSPVRNRPVNLLRVNARLQKADCINEIWKQHSVHQKARAIADDHWNFCNLARESECAFNRLIGRLGTDNYFNQFHSAHRIEKMQYDNAIGSFCFGSEFGDW